MKKTTNPNITIIKMAFFHPYCSAKKLVNIRPNIPPNALQEMYKEVAMWLDFPSISSPIYASALAGTPANINP